VRVGDAGPAELAAAFDAGAAAYDRLVGASPGYHAQLTLSARRMRIPAHGKGFRLPEADIVAVDASRGMLDAALAKRWPDSVRFVHTPVEQLAEHGITGPFDGILAAYLIRNVADRDAQLRKFRELLRPGGTLAVHEYSVRDSPTATRIWHAVCWGIIIPAGWWRTRDTGLYRYLWRSVLAFDGATRFRTRLADAGFTAVHSETMPGWEANIVHTFLADAPR
jgi:ubiquinone/menaquinone biosynthesis C-methylase UbiE